MKQLYQLASPRMFYHISGRMLPTLQWLTLALLAYALWQALLVAPADYQQGEAYRIMYIHVPSAFLSLAIYSLMTFCALLNLVWRIKIADCICNAATPLGAWFTALALITGSLWGKPMWGTWWIWDARLTSELILLFIYLGAIALRQALVNRQSQAVSIFIIIGFIDIPLIHYSVDWWQTLHQGASLAKFSRPSIALPMLEPLLLMFAAFAMVFLCMLLARSRQYCLYQSRHADWVKQIVRGTS